MAFPYEVELKVGQILGRENSCLGKIQYKTHEEACRAERNHNNCPHMHHKVHLYNCFFCGDYHLGRGWDVDDIKLLFRYNLRGDELECYLELLEEYAKQVKGKYGI